MAFQMRPRLLSVPRLDSVDLLRGAAIALMALDHVRDYFSSYHFDPVDWPIPTRLCSSHGGSRISVHPCSCSSLGLGRISL